jgi:hypothetical protein
LLWKPTWAQGIGGGAKRDTAAGWGRSPEKPGFCVPGTQKCAIKTEKKVNAAALRASLDEKKNPEYITVSSI